MSSIVTVLAGTLINFHTAEPVLRALDEAGIETITFILERYRTFAAKRLGWSEKRFRAYEELQAHAPRVRTAHRFSELLLAGPGFSETYRFREWALACVRAGAAGYLLRLRALLPSIKPELVNETLERLFTRFVPPALPSRRVLAITRSDVRHILCAPDLDVVSLMESWDHPPKAPMGYQSDTAFVWNYAMENDWREFQGDSDVRIGYPFKLHYALEFQTVSSRINGVVLYPATFCERSDPLFFRAELALLEFISAATKRAGVYLIVKPKPNGLPGEFDELIQHHPEVEIAPYKQSDGATGYFLDEAYNQERLELLERCDLVINLGTTFAIDAAVAGVPVIQLKLDDQTLFPELSQANRWVHLERHFFRDSKLLCCIGPYDDIVTVLAGEIGKLESGRAFSDYLRSWVEPVQTREDALTSICARLAQ